MRISIWLFLLLVGIATPGLAGQDKLELLGAGRMESVTFEGRPVRRLVNDVKLRRGTAILTCELAEFFEDRDEAVLQGGVRIVTEDAVLEGQEARYWGNREYVKLQGNASYRNDPYTIEASEMGYYLDRHELIATGDPVLVDSTSSLSADSVFYYEDSQMGDARGRALLDNHADTLTVQAQRLLYFAGQDSLRGNGNAFLVKRDAAQDTVFTILSDSISLESDYFFAWQNVVLSHGTARGTCERAVFQQDEELAVMEGDPELRDGSYILNGRQFNLHLDNNALRSIFIPAEPRFTQQQDFADTSYTDWLDGKQMAVEFQDGKAREVTVVDQATSYFNVIENNVFEGANKTSGDSLFILLEDDALNQISVSGGAEGTFTPSTASDVEGPIRYQSDLIVYSLDQETTVLQKRAKIAYLDMSLTAGEVSVHWRENLLRARSLTDTIGATDYPVLEQTGQEPFNGRSLVYNLQNQRGKVTAGRTKLEEGNYYGEQLTRVTQDVYFMEDGYYTTCDLDTAPHFYFASRQMKLITDRLIIARPVVLYIADIPLLALPFAVFPQKKGRTSGFLMPSYDYRPNNGGRALKGMGYYWAISDYADAKVMVDYWDQYEEFNYRGQLRYKKRYLINGNIKGEMISNRSALKDSPNWKWKLSFNHRQTIDPSFTINADGRLYGDAKFDKTYSHDQDERLQTRLHSGVNLSKKLDAIDASMSLNATYDQDLQVMQEVQSAPLTLGRTLTGPKLVLPAFSFSRGSKPLFSQKGSDSHWYNQLRWNYSSRFNNTSTWKYTAVDESDTTTVDTFEWKREQEDKHLMTHSLGLKASTPVLRYLNLVGSVSYSDKWVFEFDEARFAADGTIMTDSTGALILQQQKGLLRRGTFNTSASLNTKIYGVFPLKIGSLQAVRHTLTPSLSMRYTPDFSDAAWGYVRSVTDSAGNEFEYDPYALTQIGTTPSKRSMSLSYSLANDFDYKLFKNDEESTGRFLNWSMRGNYDFEKDSLKASDISNSLKLSLAKNLNLNLRGTYEIYERDSTGTRKIDTFRSPRLVNAGFTFQFRLAGHAPDYRQGQDQPDSLESTDTSNVVIPAALPSKSSADEIWNAQFSFNYSHTHSNPLEEARQNLQANSSVRLNLSKRWSIGYRGSYNILEQRIVSQSVNITRDLHCWNLAFTWTPGGTYSGFTLLIRPRASQLKDLKIEHKSSRRFSP